MIIRRLLNGVLLLAAALEGHPAAADDTGITNMIQNVKRVGFVGDSLTDTTAWPHWVIHTLHRNGYPDVTYFNAAICGDTIAMVKARLKADVLDLKPDLVILCIGVNDTINMVPRDQYRSDMDNVLGQIRAQNARILLLTPPSLKKPEYNAELFARDDLLRELARKHGCVLGDLHQYFESIIKKGKRLWGDDGIHQELDGWRAMGQCVLDSLGCAAPMIEKSEPDPGSVTHWMISPNVPWKTGEPIPEPDLKESFDAARAGWKSFNRDAELKQVSWWAVGWLECGGVLPFGEPRRVKDAVGVFAFSQVVSGADTQATMAVGGSPPLAVWLNGALVWSSTKAHGYHPNADRLPIRLKKGDNRLIVFSTWLFHLSIVPPGQKS